MRKIGLLESAETAVFWLATEAGPVPKKKKKNNQPGDLARANE